MDNIQKVGLVVIPVLVVVVVIIVIGLLGLQPAINTVTGKCDEWESELQDLQLSMRVDVIVLEGNLI